MKRNVGLVVLTSAMLMSVSTMTHAAENSSPRNTDPVTTDAPSPQMDSSGMTGGNSEPNPGTTLSTVRPDPYARMSIPDAQKRSADQPVKPSK
jgi:hypothetical protein